jgi:hypothetical protein
MTTAEKIFGAVAAVIVGGMVALLCTCMVWLHENDAAKNTIICKQDSTIIAQAQKIDSLQGLINRKK